MKLLVLGANGATGSRIVKRAVTAGHEVVAMVRRPDADVPGGATRVIADPLDATALAKYGQGKDAILSALGTRSLGASTLIQRETKALIAASKLGATPRVLMVSALGAGESAPEAPGMLRFFGKTLMRNIFADKTLAENALRKSDLDWTLVYLGMLNNKPADSFRATSLGGHEKLRGMPSSSRESVARFLLEAAEEHAWVHGSVIVTDH